MPQPPGDRGSTDIPTTDHVEPPRDSDATVPVAPGASTTPLSEGGGAAPELRQVGRYTVERLLGQGSFGTVYLGRDTELGRTVAIKVPNPDRITSERDVQAYLREARVLASLDHPGIVAVYDVGRLEDGRCYIVSKHIPGNDLAHRLRERRPTPAEAAIITRVAEALDHAHQRGLIHRDIKPGNLLLDREGRVYLSDFGLATTAAQLQSGSQIAGTPAYMSPEQARGDLARVDQRSDIFSLGVVFYELLTGQQPFRADTWGETKQRITSHVPTAPHRLASKIPVELSRICRRCLAKSPAERYASAHDLVVDLRRWQKQVAEDDESDDRARRILPQRLQPFEAEDATLYGELLSARGDASERSPLLQLWIEWVEETNPAESSAVGALAGPIGSGKSSFVEAGLVPRLAGHVVPVYARVSEAAAREWWDASAAEAFPGMPEGLGLADTFGWFRQQAERKERKVLVVLDQFEQWLLCRGEAEDAALLDALAVCDGRHLACLLVLRQRWLAAAGKLLERRGMTLTPEKNLGIVEPLEQEQARRILQRIGQTLGCLPPHATAMTTEYATFLKQAVGQAAVSGEAATSLERLTDEVQPSGGLEAGDWGARKVSPLRLAQLAWSMKERPWVPAGLSQMGGMAGCLVSWLEETFPIDPTDPAQRRLTSAARQVLEKLTPVHGPMAEGTHSGRELLEAALTIVDAEEMLALLRTLDHELRLIVPVNGPRPGTAATDPGKLLGHLVYRLSDVHSVNAVHQWLKHKRDRSLSIKRPERSVPDHIERWGELMVQGRRRSLWRGFAGCGAILLVPLLGLRLLVNRGCPSSRLPIRHGPRVPAANARPRGAATEASAKTSSSGAVPADTGRSP